MTSQKLFHRKSLLWASLGVLMLSLNCRLLAQISPIPISPTQNSDINIQELWLVDASESNGRLGYCYAVIDKKDLNNKIEKTLLSQINGYLSALNAFGNSMASIKCWPITSSGNLVCQKELINIHALQPKWTSSVTSNNNVNYTLSYGIEGTLFMEVCHFLWSENTYTAKPLLKIEANLDLVPALSARKDALNFNIAATLNANVVNSDCFEKNSIYFEETRLKVPIPPLSMKIDFTALSPYASQLLEKASDVHICDDEKNYYLYITLIN